MTQETKHRPGPWHTGEGKAAIIVYGNDGYAICDAKTFHGRIEPETAEANAHLIAAAPELLQTLRDCVESLERLPDVDGAFRVTCLQQAMAAIAKAIGKDL